MEAAGVHGRSATMIRMPTGRTLAMVAMVALAAGPAAAVGCRTFAYRCGGTTDQWTVIAPTDLFGSGLDDALLVWEDSMSNEWAAIWGSAANDTPQAHAVDRHGDIYVAGTTVSAVQVTRTTGQPLASPLEMGFLLKFSSAGDLRWARTYSWSFHDLSFNDLALDRSGDIVVVGRARRTRPGMSDVDYERAFVLRCEANGEPRWAVRSEIETLESLAGVDVDGDGVAHAVGQIECPTSGGGAASRMLLVGIAADGTVRYSRAFGSGRGDWGTAVLVDGASVYVGGRSPMGSYPDPKLGGEVRHPDTSAALLRMGRAGDVRWVRSFDGPMGDGLEGLAIDRDPHYIPGVGFATADYWQGEPVSGENREAFIVSTDSDGENPAANVVGSGAVVVFEEDLAECFHGFATNSNGDLVLFGVLSTNAQKASQGNIGFYEMGGQSTPLQGDWVRAACTSAEADPARFHARRVAQPDVWRALDAGHLFAITSVTEDAPAPDTSSSQVAGDGSAPPKEQIQVTEPGSSTRGKEPGQRKEGQVSARTPVTNSVIACVRLARLPELASSANHAATQPTRGTAMPSPTPVAPARPAPRESDTKSAKPPGTPAPATGREAGPGAPAPDRTVPSLSISGTIFRAGQRIIVRIAHPPAERFAWIGFYKAEASHRDYIKYNFLSNLDGHVYEDVTAPEETGRYNFRVFRDESFQPVAVSEAVEVR